MVKLLYITTEGRIMYEKKPIKLTVTVSPNIVEAMKKALKQLNSDNDIKHISQSRFVENAISNALQKNANA